MISTIELLAIKRRSGVMEAKAYAKNRGYSVRWDREGNLYIRDLLA